MDDYELMGAVDDYELMGDDDDDELGAFSFGRRFRNRRLPRRSSRRVLARKAAYVNALVPKVPGTPAPGARNFPVGFGTFTFVNAGATVATLTAQPQRPFKGARLVVVLARSAGATAEAVTITSLNVGQNNQLVSAAALPAEAFGPGAFGVELALDPATPGIDITLGLAVSAAPGIGESIAVTPMLIGNAIG